LIEDYKSQTEPAKNDNEQKVLVYLRPWNVDQMLHLARSIVGPSGHIETASDFNGVANFRLRGTDRKLSITALAQCSRLTDSELCEIVSRCRLLRNIPKKKARRLTFAAERAITDVLDRVKPSVVISITIDTYILDLLALLARKKGILFLGLVPSLLKDHFRITARGEHVSSRTVSDAEIDAALTTLIVKDYRPDFLVQSEREMRRQMWRLWLRNLPKPLWFALRRLKPGEADNLHYWASQMIASRYWSFWPRTLNGISGPALVALGEDGGPPLIYLPLQMSPEATIDYWSRDTRWIDYERFIIELVRCYRGKWRFAIKEHPNLVGYRSRGFYKRLKAEPNCVMVSLRVPSNDVVALCRGALVCTGTAGFEAALRGKPVLSDSAPYYAAPGTLLPIAALDGELPEPEPDAARQRALMAHMLRGTLLGRFLNNGTWRADNPDHRAWSEAMAVSIRGYLDRCAQAGQIEAYEATTSR